VKEEEERPSQFKSERFGEREEEKNERMKKRL